MRSLSLCCRRRWSPTSGVIAPLPSPLHRCSSKSAHVPLTSPTRSAYPVLQLSSSYPFLQLSPSYVRPAVRQQPYVAIVSAQQNATRPNMASSANGFGSSAGRPPYTVFIEGNVGSGKTTFLEHFASCPNVFLAREPVHVWQDVRGHNFLGLMYQDPKRWSFAFQSIVQRTFLELHQARPERGQNIKIMERSIYSARNIFVENLYKDNLMAAPEYAVLDAWYKWLIGNVKIESDLIIYLRTDPEVAYQRIKARNRSEEKDVPLEYIKHLHELHDNWLNVNSTDVPKNIPVIIIDANQSMDLVKKQFNGIRDLITKNASGIIEPKISKISNSLSDIQHNKSPCKLVPDSTIIPAQRV